MNEDKEPSEWDLDRFEEEARRSAMHWVGDASDILALVALARKGLRSQEKHGHPAHAKILRRTVKKR